MRVSREMKVEGGGAPVQAFSCDTRGWTQLSEHGQRVIDGPAGRRGCWRGIEEEDKSRGPGAVLIKYEVDDEAAPGGWVPRLADAADR
jgi:hypothetical protein